MAVKQQAEVTLTDYSDADSIVCWYQLNASATLPSAPTTTQTSQTVSGWQRSEPTISSDADAAKYVYSCWQTNWGDGSCEWGDVSMSASFEAAKRAWNKASAAQTSIDNLEVGGRNYIFNSAGVLANNRGSAAGSRKEYIALNLGQSYMDVPEGTQVVVSFDLVMDVATANPTLQVYNTNNDGPKCFSIQAGHGESSGPIVSFTAAVGDVINQRVSVTGYIRDRDNPPKSTNWLEFYSNYGSNNFFSIANIKLEVGNVATDWTPAPEDMATPSDIAAFQPFIIGTQTAATRFWTGNCPELSELRDGQQITYWLPYAYKSEKADDKGITAAELTPTETVTNAYSDDWLKLTLADGSDTGWVPCYYGGTSRMTSHYGAANAIHLTYRAGYSSAIPRGWWGDANYNTNTNDTARYVQYYNSIKTKAAARSASIIAGDASGLYSEVQAGSTFDLAHPVLWLTAALAANATDYSHIWVQTYDRNFATCYNSFTGIANSMVFIVGTVVGNTFTVDSSILTCVPPTEEDGKFYIPIGRLGNQSNGKNYFNFQVSVPVSLYAFLDGEFRQVTPTEVISEQYIYCQSDSILNVPTAPNTWVEEIGESITEDEGTKTSLLDDTPKALNNTGYNAYDLLLSEPLVAETTYTLYLFDVDVSHTGKTTDALGVWVYYNGGNICLGGWKGETYFKGGHANRLRLTFTPHASAVATNTGGNVAGGSNLSHSTASVTPPFIRLYNSVPSASGDMNMTVGSWHMFVGSPADAPIWTTKPPTFRTLYPVTFVAKQRKRLDGTIVCTQPVMDDTATVITGDNIVVGKIDALRVDVVNLNADNIIAGTLDAQRIKSGSISVEMFSEGVSDTFALTENVEQSFRDVSQTIDSINTDLSGQISGVSDTVQTVGKTAAEASATASALDETVNGTATAPGLVDRMSNVEAHINTTMIGDQPAIVLDATGGTSSGMAAILTNTALSFTDQGEVVSYISNRKQYITDLEVTSEAQFGKFAFIPMSDNSLAFKWVGGNS